jgi:hypothetical protein
MGHRKLVWLGIGFACVVTGGISIAFGAIRSGAVAVAIGSWLLGRAALSRQIGGIRASDVSWMRIQALSAVGLGAVVVGVAISGLVGVISAPRGDGKTFFLFVALVGMFFIGGGAKAYSTLRVSTSTTTGGKQKNSRDESSDSAE